MTDHRVAIGALDQEIRELRVRLHTAVEEERSAGETLAYKTRVVNELKSKIEGCQKAINILATTPDE